MQIALEASSAAHLLLTSGGHRVGREGERVASCIVLSFSVAI